MKIFYLIVGFLSLTFGTIGLFLPLLPTTPFLLLATFCFLKSSPKMHDWLMNHKLFGEYLSNYEKRQISFRHRRRTLIVLYIGIGLSIYFVQKPIVSIILPLIAIGVTIHLMGLKGVE